MRSQTRLAVAGPTSPAARGDDPPAVEPAQAPLALPPGEPPTYIFLNAPSDVEALTYLGQNRQTPCEECG